MWVGWVGCVSEWVNKKASVYVVQYVFVLILVFFTVTVRICVHGPLENEGSYPSIHFYELCDVSLYYHATY